MGVNRPGPLSHRAHRLFTPEQFHRHRQRRLPTRKIRIVPARDHWQLLIFANQSLEAFPELIDGMHYLSRHEQDLEVLVISRDSREDCRNLAQEQRLQVPIVPVDPAFYDHYRVRVMPFIFFLDPGGIVRWVGLVGAEEPLIHAWRMAQVAFRSGEASEVK